MKLKFRAEKKDLVIFLSFCVFLFFIVALGVANINSLAVHGKFAGLNPINGLLPPLLWSTIFLTVLIIIITFFSVKGLFFERDTGFGFELSKKTGGYSKWATEKEMKAQLKEIDTRDKTAKYAGVPLISKNGKLWVDDGEFHTLVIGSTGSGKTQCVVFPLVNSLAKKNESMIITDPKGEIYEKTSNMLRARGYKIILLNFRNPQNGNAWNPMSLPYNLYKNGNNDKAIELLDDLGINILYEENSNADPFWEKTAADYFSGIALGLFEDASEEQINLNSVGLTSTIGDEKIGGSKYDKEYFNLKDPNSPAYINASGTVLAPAETKGSIISVFKQKIKLFTSRENLSEMLSYSDFTMDSIGEQPTAVFVVIQDEKKTYHSLATIFLKQCYETLIDVAQSHGGKLPVRTNFILDEFANMPPLKDVTTMITAARSRQIRFTMIIQNFAQLNQVYGKENAETIKGNCGNIMYLITTELQALEEISKLCGEVKSKSDDKTASTPLVTVSDLQRMKMFDIIIIRLRQSPFKTSFTPNFNIDWGYKVALAKYPSRTKKPVEVFDIRDFVKAKKQEKIREMMQNNPEANNRPYPMMPGFPMIPPSEEKTMPYPGEMVLPSMRVEDDYIKKTPGMMRNNYAPIAKEEKDFDIDSLVKKIDMKIAELEREEQAEKAREEKEKPEILPKEAVVEPLVEDVQPVSIKPNVRDFEQISEVKPLDSKKIENQVNRLLYDYNNQPKKKEEPVKPIEVESDEFFDDFFEN